MDPPSAKRKRLSHACNYCRAQKKRCDEQKPSCNKCTAAGVVCITTNPRKPGAPEVERRRAAESDLRLTSGSISRVQDSQIPTGKTPTQEPGGRSVSSTPSTTITAEEPAGNEEQPDVLPPQAGYSYADSHRDMHSALNSDETDVRKKYVGASSLQVFAQWVDLALATGGCSTERFCDGFRYGMSHAEEFDLPLTVTLPSIASLGFVQAYLDIFLSRVNALYPFLDEVYLHQLFTKFKNLTDCSRIGRSEIPELAALYTATSIGAAELNGADDPLSKMLLEAAYSVLSHIIAYPYLSSIQALGLISIALRGRLKDGAASQTMGLAVRIAHSIGLHRTNLSTNDSTNSTTHKRVWCACYTLEKNLQFDSGRPSEIDGGFAIPTKLTLSDPEPHYAQALLGFSQIQSRINLKIFSPNAVRKSTQDLLPALAEVDAQLTAWTDTVPEIIRPGRECTICPTDILPQATFIATLYYSTLAMIHRTSLLVDQKLHRSGIEMAALSPTAKHRLLAGESICANAARSIVRCVNDLLARHGPTQLVSPQAPLLAIYILVIYTMRHPESWTADSDLSLIQKMASITEQLYLSNGQHPQFTAMCSKLHTLAAMVVSKNRSKRIPTIIERGQTRNSIQGLTSQGVFTDGSNNARPSNAATEYNNTNKNYARQTPASINHRLIETSAALQEATWLENESALGLSLIDQDRGSTGSSMTQPYPSRLAASIPGDKENPAISPGVIDRLWTTTLTDSLDFPYITQSNRLNPYPNSGYEPSSTSAPHSNGGLDMSLNSDMAGPDQAYHALASAVTTIEQSSSNNNNNTLNTQQLLSPAASNDQTVSNYMMPEARYLFGVPLLSDIGHELSLLYEEGPTMGTELRLDGIR